MSNGGFTLGGKTAKQRGMRMLRESQRPILPSTVDRILPIPGSHGAWDFGSDLGPKPFGLECAFVTGNSMELQQKIFEFASDLLDSMGRPRTLELIFEVAPDRTYHVRYSGSLSIDRLVGMGRFTLPLVAFDPFAYGAEQVTDVIINDSLETFTVSSDGNVATDPVIVIQNTGSTTIHGFTLKNIFLVD